MRERERERDHINTVVYTSQSGVQECVHSHIRLFGRTNAQLTLGGTYRLRTHVDPLTLIYYQFTHHLVRSPDEYTGSYKPLAPQPPDISAPSLTLWYGSLNGLLVRIALTIYICHVCLSSSLWSDDRMAHELARRHPVMDHGVHVVGLERDRSPQTTPFLARGCGLRGWHGY